MQFMVITMVVVMPIICMEKGRIVKFVGDISIIPIKESNVMLMKALHQHCQGYKEVVDRGGLVPQYPHVSSEVLCLVNNALNVRPDTFADFYHTLSQRDRDLLIKVSGQYNQSGKKVMLDVPEITKRLIDVYFTDDGLRNHIKKYICKDDEDYVRNYFKEQLIYSKRLLMLKQPMGYGSVLESLRQDVYLGSVFLNGFHTIHPYDYPISLRTGDKVRQTYATCFGIDNYEYRITDVRDNQCLLWVINHDNPDATFSTIIKHKGNIKGCCFSSTILRQAQDDRNVEGVLTYSDHDMVFSTITTLNGVSFVDSVFVDTPYQIVDACFEPIKSTWHVGSYEGLESVVRAWSMRGKHIEVRGRQSFKKYGLLEKIAICQTASGYRWAEILGVADLYSAVISDTGTDDGGYYESERIPLASRVKDFYDSKIIKVGDFINVFNLCHTFFKENPEADLWSKSESEVHRVYSPQGTFLMCNSLKKKWGMLYVETIIQDAVTHKQILSIDTLYAGFAAVGFTYDETELVFLDHLGSDSKVSLLNYEDKQMLFQIEDVACANLGVASLVKRLCMECREKGIITLYEGDPTRTMLIDWSRKSPELLKLLTTCLPITKIKK